MLLGRGNALYAMHAAFVFQPGINLVPLNRGNHFFHSPKRRRRTFEDLHFPALRFGVARIHAEKLSGEKRGFVAARAGADFDEHAFLLVGILGKKQKFQLALDGFLARSERFLFVVRHLLHLGVVRFEEELMRPGEIFHDLLVFAMFRDDFLELGMLLGDLLKARGITHDFRRRELLRHLLVARIELVQLFGQCKNGHGNLSFRFEALD